MKKEVVRVLVTLGVVAFLAHPALATTPCVNLDLTVSPSKARPGQLVTASGSATNCSTDSENVLLDYTITGPNGTVRTGSASVFLKPGETRSGSVTFIVPLDTPPGVYTLTVTAFVEGEKVATAQATLEVT